MNAIVGDMIWWRIEHRPTECRQKVSLRIRAQEHHTENSKAKDEEEGAELAENVGK